MLFTLPNLIPQLATIHIPIFCFCSALYLLPGVCLVHSFLPQTLIALCFSFSFFVPALRAALVTQCLFGLNHLAERAWTRSAEADPPIRHDARLIPSSMAGGPRTQHGNGWLIDEGMQIVCEVGVHSSHSLYSNTYSASSNLGSNSTVQR